MSYSDFTIGKVQEDFGLELVEDQDLFGQIKEIEISAMLAEELELKVPLALAINTEKARSELIIAGILVEVKRILKSELPRPVGGVIHLEQAYLSDEHGLGYGVSFCCS
jgi:hypothetical protein